MKILNPLRRWLKKGHAPVTAYYEAARFSRDRTWLPGLTQDAIQDISSGDRSEIVRRARYFEKNSPLFQQILDLIEQNVVGTGVNPTPDSESSEYNQKALEAWTDWCKFADLTSRQHFYTLEAIISRAQACDGEIFLRLTNGESGRPRVQLIESHRVKSATIPRELRDRYAGLIDVDGVLVDASGRPQYYMVHNGVTVSDSVRAGSVSIIPAAEIVHFFEPSRAAQYRGISLFHAAIITLHDLDDLQRYEMLAAKDAAMRSNVVTTENGELPDSDQVVARSTRVRREDGTEESKKVYYETAFGGKTVVLKHGDKWEQGESLRPSAAMRDFWEYLTEQVCRSAGISYAAVKGYNGWGGAALRAAITSDNRFYEVRTSVLTSGLQRVYEHVIGWHNERGMLGKVPANWRKCHWQPPRRATVDVGRESTALLNELRAGARTFRDVLGELGLDWRDVLRQRAEEEAFIDMLSNQFKVDRSRISSFNPNERSVQNPQQQDAQKPDEVTAIRASSPAPVLAFSLPTALDLPADLATALPAEFVWMPAGTHEISAGTLSGETFKGKVVCNEAGALAVMKSFTEISASGLRVWIDFNHEDAEAAAWVRGFSWDPARGIVCQVEWTREGAEALREKSYYSFSPAFLANRETGRITGLIFGHAAGGLVNAPAFGAAMPALIAARLGGAESTHNPASDGLSDNHKSTVTMNKELLLKILAALAVVPPADATEQQLAELVAKHTASIKPGSEVEKLQKQLEDAVTAKAKAEADLAAANKAKADADAAVTAAKAKTDAPAVIVVSPGISEFEAGSIRASAKPNPLEAVKAMAKETDPRKRGAIYCADVRDFAAKTRGVAEILASNSLGSVTGDIIVLRALDLLKLNFPALSAITTDFSDQQARQGQVIKTRIVSIPTVVTLNDTTGWASSDATTTDVSVTIGQPKGVQISYGSSEIAGTSRDLFGEQVEACHYALGKDLIDALYAVITAGNFANATTKATASLARADLVAMEKALASRGVEGIRHLLLNADTYEKMSNDTTLVNLAAYQMPDVITGTGLPPIAGFNVIRAINLPSTGNLTGFGFRKDALVVATRLPEDYTRAFPGASHGSVGVVTNPDTGISVQKVDFVDHNLAKAFSRIAWSYGVAKGNGSSGQRLISA